ncbi:MAG TPA: hypothetical protein VH575_07720 [Gemmataceae bacterium]|jgi:hypothetical protein
MALLSCPDFKTQAAYFLVALDRELDLLPPELIVDLAEDEHAAVEKKVAPFMRQRRLLSGMVAGNKR